MVICIRDSRIHGRRRRADIPALDLKPEAFVSFLENHDQVSNSATGDRLRLQTSPGRYRAMTALLLLGPWTPLLFQGEEFGASTPFLYFSEVGDEKLREAVRKGRFEFLAQFPSAASARSAALAVPYEIETFRSCKLDWSEREKNHAFSNLHRDLIKLRREDSRLCQQSKRADRRCRAPRGSICLTLFR